MKKTWAKPTMCEVAAGFEISRYLPAEVQPKK
ncbi:pyrroloquinoline quinone precursor peptide PqqA [Mesorhizobium sp. ANAO-SY3R2]